MLSNTLAALAVHMDELGRGGQPLSPDACRLLAVNLADVAERVALLENQPVPPSARVVAFPARKVAA
jgi:hypothetical protein